MTRATKPPSVSAQLAAIKASTLSVAAPSTAALFPKTPKDFDPDTHIKPSQPSAKDRDTGERCLVHLLTCLMLDFNQKNIDPKHLTVMAMATQLYMHTSSYYPAQGYGRAVVAGLKAPLDYYRSEADSSARKLHDSVHASGHGKSYLPRNTQFMTMLEGMRLNREFSSKLAWLDEDGFKTQQPDDNTEKMNYFGPKIGYSGARKNNFSTVLQAMQAKFIKGGQFDTSAAQAFLERYVKSAKVVSRKVKKLKPAVARERIKDLVPRFKKLHIEKGDTAVGLATQLQRRRQQLGEDIEDLNDDLLASSVEYNKAQSSVVLELYPDLGKTKRKHGTYKNGLTNVLIGFFAGLLNHNAAQAGLQLFLTRRQSFGFLRTTVTEVGSLRIRISMGLESKQFFSLLESTICEFDDLLYTIDFTCEDEDVDDLVTQCKAPSTPGKARGDSYLKASMRSDNDRVASVWIAHKYLDRARHQNKDDYLESAFRDFMKHFVVERVNKFKNDKKSVGEKLQTQGVRFLPKKNKNPQLASFENDSLICELLARVSNNAVKMVEAAQQLLKPGRSIKLPHTILHVLLKLHKKCSDAKWLVNKVSRYEQTHVYARAHLLIEDILEYTIQLDGLLQLHNACARKRNDTIKSQLRGFQKKLTAQRFGVREKYIDVFYTDGGMQAIIASLIAMYRQTHPLQEAGQWLSDRDTYVSSGCYFEMDSFFKEIGGNKITNSGRAVTACFDISEFPSINWRKFKKLKAVVFDITHCDVKPTSDFKTKVAALRKEGVTVVLAASSLKHEQLGMDKFQSGKIVVLKPTTADLVAKADLVDIDKEALHPVVASFLLQVKAINAELDDAADLAPNVRAMSLFRPSRKAAAKEPVVPKVAKSTGVISPL